MPELAAGTNEMFGQPPRDGSKRRVRGHGEFERFRWILVSYLTRPLFLVIVGFGTSLLAVGWILPIREYPVQIYPNAPAPRMLVNSQASLDEVRRLGRQREVDGIDLTALWMEVAVKKRWDPQLRKEVRELKQPSESFFEVLNEFPNLRWVKYEFVQRSNGLTQVAKRTGLEYLALDSGATIDLAVLRPLQNIRRIDFQLYAVPTNIAALAEFPKLETLVFESRSWVGDAVLCEMQRLPHLKTLVLSFDKSWPAQASLTRAGFEALAQVKSLKTLYVGGYRPEDRTALFAMAQLLTAVQNGGAGRLNLVALCW